MPCRIYISDVEHSKQVFTIQPSTAHAKQKPNNNSNGGDCSRRGYSPPRDAIRRAFATCCNAYAHSLAFATCCNAYAHPATSYNAYAHSLAFATCCNAYAHPATCYNAYAYPHPAAY